MTTILSDRKRVPNNSRHRMSGNNVNLKLEHWDVLLLGALGRWGCLLKLAFTILSAITLAAAARASESPGTTNTHPKLSGYGFTYAKASPEQRKTMDGALPDLKLEGKLEKACETVEDAGELLWRSINIATGSTRTCTDYKGYFWFSRLDWARQDDRTFKSGFAVKKGTGEIYRWDERKAPANGLNQ